MISSVRQMVCLLKIGLSGRLSIYLAALALLALGAVGCSQGAYPLDFFQEMHYQQSYKAAEPPRISVPQSAVPYFPAQESTSFKDGGYLYQVNCSMCHGQAGKGDGAALQIIINKYKYAPAVTPDLTSLQVKGIGVEGIEGFLTSGVVIMPSFQKLLTPEERHAIADYVVNCLQRGRPQGCP